MTDRRRAPVERVYDLLLALYPREFRSRFGLELLDLFRDKRRAAAFRGRLSLVTFWVRIVVDVVCSAFAERFAHRAAVRQSPFSQGVRMEGLVQDVRYAVRAITRRPALSVVIVVTLALGIGANTAIFSLVNTVLLRQLPYRDPDRLVMIWERQPERESTIRPVRPANFFEWKTRTASFEDVAWSRDGIFNLTGNGEPESIIGYRFSANMLSVLGVQPVLGRGFTPDEDRPGAPRVVLLSDKLWKRRFAEDRGILGRALTLNGESYTVIGVMPPDFRHPQRAELWTPVALSAELAGSRVNGVLRIVGRLKPGVTRERAEAEVATLYEDIARRFPDTNAGLTASISLFGQGGDAKPLLLILFAGVGFVLLIACANIANLLLADAASRRQELAMRSALGATRARVIRQMLAESVLLAIAGGALGALITWWMKDALVVLFPSTIANLNLPLIERVHVNGVVFAFAFAVSIATGLLFGLLPAWKVARSDLQAALKDAGRSGSSSRRTHTALVVVEVSLSIVLLAGALLMIQSFVRVQRTEFGFDPDGVLTGRVLLPQYRYADLARVEAFTRALIPRLQSIPGVETVGITNYLPLSGWDASIDFSIEGRPVASSVERPSANFQVTTEDYFNAMGIRLVAGRTFTARDDRSGSRVLIINQTLATKYWPGENPVGRRVSLDSGSGPQSYEIVGIVGDVRSAGLEEPVQPEMFFSYWQGGESVLGIALKTTVPPESLASEMRAAVWAVDSEQPVTYVMPMTELAAESLAFRRAGMRLAGGFGLLALALAAIGIYGVLSYSVARRTREIGVRVALGATGRKVAALVVRDSLLMTGGGIAVGIAAAVVLMRFLTAVLFDVRPGDPATYVAVATILLTVAFLAAFLPARRAAAVDPIIALRSE